MGSISIRALILPPSQLPGLFPGPSLSLNSHEREINLWCSFAPRLYYRHKWMYSSDPYFHIFSRFLLSFTGKFDSCEELFQVCVCVCFKAEGWCPQVLSVNQTSQMEFPCILFPLPALTLNDLYCVICYWGDRRGGGERNKKTRRNLCILPTTGLPRHRLMSPMLITTFPITQEDNYYNFYF